MGSIDSANESRRPWVAGLVVREHSETPSHVDSIGTIHEFLERHGIPGIAGIDTRSLTLHIRDVGDTRGVIIQECRWNSRRGSCRSRAERPHSRGSATSLARSRPQTQRPSKALGPHIVVLDCGVKRNIVRSLVKRGCRVTVVPFGTTLEEIERLQPDGVVVSPGPGIPANLDAGLDRRHWRLAAANSVLRDLSGSPAPGAVHRRRDSKAEIRASRWEPFCTRRRKPDA